MHATRHLKALVMRMWMTKTCLNLTKNEIARSANEVLEGPGESYVEGVLQESA